MSDPATGTTGGVLIYRKGGTNPANWTPRPVDQGKLSFWTSLSPPVLPGEPARFPPGAEYFVVDAARLPEGSVIFDLEPPGHVSVVNVAPGEIRDAIVDKGRMPG